ncbi:hypothetical protein AB0H17_28310 [Streptomyces olivoreticuli]
MNHSYNSAAISRPCGDHDCEHGSWDNRGRWDDHGWGESCDRGGDKHRHDWSEECGHRHHGENPCLLSLVSLWHNAVVKL